jgi:hypothetical protein
MLRKALTRVSVMMAVLGTALITPRIKTINIAVLSPNGAGRISCCINGLLALPKRAVAAITNSLTSPH